MRSVLVLPVALSFVFGIAAAQDTSLTSPTPSRWTFSAGPEWTPTFSNRFYGARVRAEYDLIKPTGPLRLRFEAGGFWSPTQSFSGRYFIDSGTFGGMRQTFDFTVGLSASITPLPRARFSPYLTMAAVARQTWNRQSSWRQNADGSFQFFPLTTGSFGDVVLQPGIGIRARIAGRLFQLELRHYRNRSLTLGTQLPF
jgi:hypothetical protein